MPLRRPTAKASPGIRRIGITGVIGSGKSAVAGFLRRAGYAVLDSDAIAKQCIAELPRLRKSIAAAFGADVFDADGALNRRLLAERAFSDAKGLTALNNLVHPHVLERLDRLTAQAERKGEDLIFVESALIYESKIGKLFDYVIVVTAPEEMIYSRAGARSAVDRERIGRRLAMQMSQEKKAERADFVLRNDGSLEELAARTAFILGMIKAHSGTP